MKRLVSLLSVVMLMGCQSEIDKCVEALIRTDCEGATDPNCNKNMTIGFEGEYRLQCLRAQAGKQ